MLIILLSLVATSAAHKIHRFVNIDENGNYRAFLPGLGLNFAFGTGNGHRSVPTYENPARNDGAVNLSDQANQGRAVQRRFDTQYGYHYPYQSNNGQWNRPVTEATWYNQYGNNQRKDSNVYDYVRNVENKETTVQPRFNETDRFNGAVDNSRDINTQSNDANVNYQQINTNNVRRNQTTYEPSNYNNTNSVQTLENTSHADQGSPYYHSSNNNASKHDKKTDDTNIFSLTTAKTDINRNGSRNVEYSTKTTEDNEVTGVYETRSHDGNDDRWIWANGDEKMETTTIPMDLDDRAAFDGSNCPKGTIRLGNSCVAPD